MRRLPRFAVLAILFGMMLAGSGAAETSSSASSSASSVDGLVDVRLGGLVLETGARVALELVRDQDADCFGQNVMVERLHLLDSEENPVHQVVYEPAVEVDGWLGRVELADAEGQPLSAGDYSLVVTTSVGSFTAEVELADASRFRELGRYSATASVCGLSLRVHRLVTEEDADAHVTLRLGDRLLVALEGNPTTGYEWTNTLLHEFAVLRETEEREFRPNSDLVGAGGVFLFRYEAAYVGPQAFRFAYQRPWESVQPLELLEFSADVF
ncbi:protease inhibitor I42 family protein [Candidatus Bipolaricaulota bacterium]